MVNGLCDMRLIVFDGASPVLREVAYRVADG